MKNTRPTKAVGRKRRAVGWALVALSLLVAGVWAASGWRCVQWWKGDAYWYCANGSVGVNVQAGSGARLRQEERPIFALADRQSLSWRVWYPTWSKSIHRDLAVVAYGGDRVDFWYTAVSLWPIPLLLWTSAVLLLRSGYLARRRANTGMCGKCNYNLAGLTPDAPCPECGVTRHLT
jgi:hypothetical protein